MPRTLRHLALALVCATALAASEPPSSNAPDTVIYPRPQAPQHPGAADRDGWGRAPWLIAALALAAGGAWWLKHSRANAGPAGRPGHKLAIEETRSLGNREYLVVATYEDRKVLLGVAPGHINLLCTLSDDRKASP